MGKGCNFFTHLCFFLFVVKHSRLPSSPAHIKKLPPDDTSNQAVYGVPAVYHATISFSMLALYCRSMAVWHTKTLPSPYHASTTGGNIKKRGTQKKKHSPRDAGRRNICFINLLMHRAIGVLLNKQLRLASLCRRQYLAGTPSKLLPFSSSI